MKNKDKTGVFAAGAFLVWLVAGSTQHCLAQATSSPLAPPPQAAVDDHASSPAARAPPETNAPLPPPGAAARELDHNRPGHQIREGCLRRTRTRREYGVRRSVYDR